MTATANIPAELDPGHEAGDRATARFAPSQRIALFLVVLAGRLVFSADRTVFSISPDEPANLAMARWLSGRGHWNMSTNVTYRPGFATLLAPLFWITDDQATLFRAGLAVGAVCGGLSAVLLGHLALRLTDLSSRSVLIASGAIALSPAALSASAHMWAEPLVTLLFLGTLATLLAFFDSPRLTLGCATLSVAAGAWVTHGRMLALFGCAAVMVCGLFVVQRRWRDAIVAAGAIGLLVWLSSMYVQLFQDRLWTESAQTNTIRGVFAGTGPLEVARSVMGQGWYLLASTVCLFGLGVALAIVGSFGTAGRLRRDLRVVLAVTLPLIALSMVFMSNRARVDQLVYGRYNDAVIWPLLVLAVGALASVRGRSWSDLPLWMRGAVVGLPLLLLQTGLVVAISLQNRRRDQVEFVDMIAGLGPVLRASNPLPVLPITIGAAALFVLSVAVALHSSGRQTAILIVTAAALSSAAISGHGALYSADELGETSSVVRDVGGDELPSGAAVTFGFVSDALDPGVAPYLQGYYSQLYQWYLSDHHFTILHTGEYPADSYVFAPLHDRVLENMGACIVWRDPGAAMVLWYSNVECPHQPSTIAAASIAAQSLSDNSPAKIATWARPASG